MTCYCLLQRKFLCLLALYPVCRRLYRWLRLIGSIIKKKTTYETMIGSVVCGLWSTQDWSNVHQKVERLEYQQLSIHRKWSYEKLRYTLFFFCFLKKIVATAEAKLPTLMEPWHCCSSEGEAACNTYTCCSLDIWPEIDKQTWFWHTKKGNLIPNSTCQPVSDW